LKGFFALPYELRLRIYEDCVSEIFSLKPPMFNGHGTRPYNGCTPRTTFNLGILIHAESPPTDPSKYYGVQCPCIKRPKLNIRPSHRSWKPYRSLLKTCKLISRAFRSEFLSVYASAAPFAFHERYNLHKHRPALTECERSLLNLDIDICKFLRSIGPQVSRHIRVLRYYCKPWTPGEQREDRPPIYDADQGWIWDEPQFDQIDGHKIAEALPVLDDARAELRFEFVVVATTRRTRVKTLCFKQRFDQASPRWVYMGHAPIVEQFVKGDGRREWPIAELRHLPHEHWKNNSELFWQNSHKGELSAHAVFTSWLGARKQWRDTANEDKSGVHEGPRFKDGYRF